MLQSAMGNSALVGRSEEMTFGVDKLAEGLGSPGGWL